MQSRCLSYCQCGKQSSSAGVYSVKTRRQLAQQKVFQTSQALHRLGVKTTVEVYSGKLTKNLRSYVHVGGAQLVLMRSGMGQRIRSFLRGPVSTCGLFKRPSASSVLLLHPGAQL